MEDLAVSVEPTILEMLVHRRALGEQACEHPEQAARLMPKLIGVSVAGLAAYAAVQAAVLTATGSGALPWGLRDASLGERAVIYFTAYGAGLFGAQIAALPSAYFYALQTGIRTHSWRIAVEAMRAQATSAVVLLGLLPVYLAAGLGVPRENADLAQIFVHGFIGYSLPFVGGIVGTWSLIRAFTRIAHERRADSARSPWPTLMVLAWAALFSAMAPLAVLRVLNPLP